MSKQVISAPDLQEIFYPRFAALYNWLMGQTQVRRMCDPLRRATAGQAHGVALEVGAGAGQNFPFYDPTRVVRVEAVEPGEAMLSAAEPSRQAALVPIRLSRAPVEALPFRGGLQPMLVLHATRLETHQELPPQSSDTIR
jgi:hypothetical protein